MKTITLKNAFLIANIIGFMLPVYPAAAQTTDQKPALEQQTGSDDGTKTEKPNRGPRRKGGPLMRVLDADRDGILSADEIENAGTALKSLDTDGDGNVTRDELPRKKGRQGKEDNQGRDRAEKED